LTGVVVVSDILTGVFVVADVVTGVIHVRVTLNGGAVVSDVVFNTSDGADDLNLKFHTWPRYWKSHTYTTPACLVLKYNSRRVDRA